jgi:hypothetical protein
LDPLDPESARQWPIDDGINVRGIPLGSLDFIESYLFGKRVKHRQLLTFITEVVAAGFPREAVVMLTGAARPRLTHLMKSVEKNSSTQLWMKEMDNAHVSTWLLCLTASPVLGHALRPIEWDMLTDWMDLPSSYGGSGLNSLTHSADEGLLGPFARIAAALVAFCRKTELPVYIGIARALEALGEGMEVLEEEIPPSTEHPCATLEAINVAAARATIALSPLLCIRHNSQEMTGLN